MPSSSGAFATRDSFLTDVAESQMEKEAIPRAS